MAGGVAGLAISATFGWEVLLVGAAGYACGIGYDVWLRRHRLAWLAFAAAFPLLLAYAWLGAAGTLPPRWPLLLPMAAAIGPALHLSNSLIDVDTDAADPNGGLAGQLGRAPLPGVLSVLLVVVYGLAWAAVCQVADGSEAGAGAGARRSLACRAAGMLTATLTGGHRGVAVGRRASRPAQRRLGRPGGGDRAAGCRLASAAVGSS